MNGLTAWKITKPENILPVSEKTGGLLVTNSNFFFNGIGPVQEAIKGYYLLSYIPPQNSFGGNRSDYHRLRVKVNRSGVEVHSRDGFFAVSHAPILAEMAKDNDLVQASLNPLWNNNLKLSISSGYVYADKIGFVLRTWLHLDGANLIFKEKKSGDHSLELGMAILTVDSEGEFESWKPYKYDFIANEQDMERIRKEGIDVYSSLDVKHPGYYHVSAAIGDRISGKMGTCYQFMEIPDLSKKRLSLSSIFVLNNGKEQAAIKWVPSARLRGAI